MPQCTSKVKLNKTKSTKSKEPGHVRRRIDALTAIELKSVLGHPYTMADPISIAAFTMTLVGVAYKIGEGVEKFTEIDANIRDFRETIRNLHAALRSVARTLEQHPTQLPFEREHHQDIYRILKSCSVTLDRLRSALPELALNAGVIGKAVASFKATLKTSVVRDLVSHITSYTQVLQLSLITLSL